MDQKENAEVSEIPSYFICPISMQIMRDPITVCTGITYDRESMEKWIYSCGKNTCPATMQVMPNYDMIPNHTLRRLIQGWCLANSSKGVQRIPTPKPSIDCNQVNKLLRDFESCPPFQVINGLKKLSSLADESEANRRCIVACGGDSALISVIETNTVEMESGGYECAMLCDEALRILYKLPIADETAESLTMSKTLRPISWILKRGSCNGRFHSAMLLKTVSSSGQKRLQQLIVNANNDLIDGLLQLLTEEVCHQATVASLEVLMDICSPSRNHRIKAIEAGAISVLIELLPESQRKTCEKMLCLLDILCECAEGRATTIDHAMGIASISKKIFRVSEAATEKAVRILWSLCKFCPTPGLLKEMVQSGAVYKLCMLLQLECTSKTKQKAREILRTQYGKHWISSPCAPSYL
nr:LaPUB22 [Larix kaempferi]